MMRRLAIMATAAVLLLAACSRTPQASPVPRPLDREGVAPYSLTEEETYLLRAFGMEGDAQLLAFRAPQEAASLDVDVLRLAEDGTWESLGSGGVSLDSSAGGTPLGTFAIRLGENGAVDFYINTTSQAAYHVQEVSELSAPCMSTKDWLREYVPASLGEPIPVSLCVYDSGTQMRSYTLQDWEDPSVFADMDLVMVVTLTFRGDADG